MTNLEQYALSVQTEKWWGYFFCQGCEACPAQKYCHSQPNGTCCRGNFFGWAKTKAAELPNDPLTLEELRGMDGEPVWCEDNTVDAGIVRLAEDWETEQMGAHFWIFDSEGNPQCYNMRLMLEMGAKFYRHKPDGGGK